MKKYFDTSIFVAATIKKHPRYNDCKPLLEQAINEGHDLYVSTHSMAEMYSNLTRLPQNMALTPNQVGAYFRKSLIPYFKIVSLDKDDYLEALNLVEGLQLVSGSIYDALHYTAAKKVGCEELFTLNGRDFKRLMINADITLIDL